MVMYKKRGEATSIPDSTVQLCFHEHLENSNYGKKENSRKTFWKCMNIWFQPLQCIAQWSSLVLEGHFWILINFFKLEFDGLKMIIGTLLNAYWVLKVDLKRFESTSNT